MNAKPPEQIYLQCYEDDGSLSDLVRDDVTWCVDQINDSDAIYILATPELAALLERLADEANLQYEKAGDAGDSRTEWAIQLHTDDKAARELAARIREVLEVSDED